MEEGTCPNCGAELVKDGNDKYCDNCGATPAAFDRTGVAMPGVTEEKDSS